MVALREAQLAVAQAEGAPLSVAQLALGLGDWVCEALIEGEREGVTVEHPEADQDGELLALLLAWLAVKVLLVVALREGQLAVAQAEGAPLAVAQLALAQALGALLSVAQLALGLRLA